LDLLLFGGELRGLLVDVGGLRRQRVELLVLRRFVFGQLVVRGLQTIRALLLDATCLVGGGRRGLRLVGFVGVRARREDESDDRTTDHRERDADVELAIRATLATAEPGDARLALAILGRDLRIDEDPARVIRSV